jgi:isocitrate dehydrogenase kinase/phosphatase
MLLEVKFITLNYEVGFREYLNNPKTMDIEHVRRALHVRHLDNINDITLMLQVSLFVWTVATFIIGLLLYRSKNWPALLIWIAVMATGWIGILRGYIAIKEETFLLIPSFNFTFIQLFYLCDGIVIMLAYSFNQSYEAMNLWLFFVIQPLIILTLFIAVYRLQSKLRKHGI